MLAEGAPVHARDRYGHTPLHDAVTNKYVSNFLNKFST